MAFLILFIVFAFFNSFDLPLSNAVDWNYEDLGPDVWPDLFADCSKTKQSPIDIKTACTTYKEYPPFQFSPAYAVSQDFRITNDGHMVTGVPVNPRMYPLILSGGGLTENFTFDNFHLHWGENYGTGSEHQLNGKKYSGEIHFVHANAARTQFAALGIFIQSRPATDSRGNRGIKQETKRQASSTDTDTLDEWKAYLDTSDDLNRTNATTTISLQLTALFGDNLAAFYRYTGSLTMPPCTENVIWTVFQKPVIFSDDELKGFRKYLYRETLREPQPLYGRTVYRNYLNVTRANISDYLCCADNSTPNSNNTQSSTASIYTNSIVMTNIKLFIYSVLLVFISFFHI